MFSSGLITNPDDPRIAAAARGLGPELTDTDDLPGKSLFFAPNTATYRVMNDGSGTNVYLYGTSSEGHSVCVRAENFRPYVCVNLERLDTMVADESMRQKMIEMLVEELQVRLTAAIALDKRIWSPERQSLRAAMAGSFVHLQSRDRCALAAPKNNCRPIVDWDIIQGSSMRGTGPGSGYRGLKGQRYLRLYTLSPPLVPMVRDLLRCKYGEMSVIAQAEKLGNGRRAKKTADELDAEKAQLAQPVNTIIEARPKTKLTKLAELKHYKKISGWSEDAYIQLNNDDCGDDDNTEDGDPQDEDCFEPDEDEDLEMLNYEKAQFATHADNDEILEEHAVLGNEDDSAAASEQEDPRRRELIESEIARSDFALECLDVVDGACEADAEATEDSTDDGDGGLETAVAAPPSRQREFTTWYPDSEANMTALRNRLEKRFIRRALRDLLTSSVTQRSMLSKPIYDIYDGDMDFTLRMMIDSRFKPEQWLKVTYDARLTTMPNGKRRPSNDPLRVRRPFGRQRETRQQIELHCDYRFLECDVNDPIQTTIPQHRTVSLDCEMLPGVKMEFPVPKKNEMLQCVFIIKDTYRLERRPKLPVGKFYHRSVSFTLLPTECLSAPREYCTERHILSFPDEKTMYECMARFVALLNPQIVGGYNSDNFDLPYMLERSKEVGAGKVFANSWGKTLYNSAMTVTERSFESAAVGKILFKDIKAPGMETFDLFLKLKKDPQFKERDYSLNAIAAKYANEQKDDVAYSALRGLQQTEAGREKMRVYCEKDALLPLEIMEILKMMPGLIEMARMTGVTVGMLVKRGMQIRAKCSLFFVAVGMTPRPMFYTRTDEERELTKEDTYDGATVIEPKRGLYEDPVGTLDYEGLYPAIMRTFDICFSTRINHDFDALSDPGLMQDPDPARNLTLDERRRRFEANTFTINQLVVDKDNVPVRPLREEPLMSRDKSGPVRFVRHEILTGLIPMILEQLSETRKKAKKDMRTAKDAGDNQLADIHDMRQNGCKLLANSMYGYLGSTSSSQYTPDGSASVTCRGRAILLLSAEMAVDHFSPLLRAAAEARLGHALPPDAVVIDIIYGDTDSFFPHLPYCTTVEEAAKWCIEMAKYVTDQMRARYNWKKNVLTLLFEKVFRRLLLLAKKKYCGLLYKLQGTADVLLPSPGDGIPSLSGLDGKRRDTTLLVADNFLDVVALLLDYRYDTETNLRRTRHFVWREMVRPLLNNTINLRKLACSKQVRKSIDQYTTNKAGNKQTPPIHVQLFEKEVARAGGPDSAGAPRSGDRLSYVVIKGKLKEKVSSRGENPVYVLEHNKTVDGYYYLDKHVKPAILRLVIPIICKRIARFGKTEAAKLRAEKERASEKMFGHKTDYVDRFDDSDLGEVVPRTLIARVKADAESKTTRVSQKLLPTYDPRTGEVLRRPRYNSNRITIEEVKKPNPPPPTQQQQQKKPAGNSLSRFVKKKTAQRSLAEYAAQGVLCESCKEFFPARTQGFVCDACIAKRPKVVKQSVSTLCNLLVDMEDLNRERAVLVDRCNDCVGCRDAPRPITCENTACPTLWDRKLNLRSIDELQKRITTLTDIVRDARAMPAVNLNVDSDIDTNEPSAKREKKIKNF